MKMILNILIMVAQICASESSVYDWHVKTIESDSDFGDDLKVETALNNERQQDLFKISGKTNNIEYYPNSYYSPFNKNIKDKSNEAAVAKENFQKFIEENAADFKSLSDQNSNFNRNLDSERDNKTSYGNYSDQDYNDVHYNKYKTKQYHIFENPQRQLHENPEEFNKNLPSNNNKHSDDRDENNGVIVQDENKKQQLNIKGHMGTGNENEINNKQTPNNKFNKSFKENKKSKSEDHSSGNYIDIESFVGTNLFDSTAKKCFTNEDVVLLTMRKHFEILVPKNLPQCLFDDHLVALLLNYFYICHQMIIQTSSVNFRHLAEKAFYDTLGGYLNFYVVPVTKYSYYAGQISLSAVQEVLTLHQASKTFLNTNGNGWKAPLQNVLIELKYVHIEPLHVPELDEDARNEASFCMQLDMNIDDNQPDNDKIIVQLPKLETENEKGYLGNIWLPLRRKRTFDLKAEGSTYIVAKFYEIVTKCYRYENIDQELYNQQFKTWLLEYINIHLSDEEFYPGLGAVLRVYEYLKERRKDVIGIGNEFSAMGYNKKRNHQIRSEQLNNRSTTKHNEAKEKTIDNDLTESNLKGIVDQQAEKILQKHSKLEDAVQSVSNNSKAILRSLDLTPTKIAIIAIPVVSICLIIIICCYKCFCKKKRIEIPIEPQKHSSSSSSNLFNSPVRFFNIRRKPASNSTAVNYSLNERGNKKKKRSVKMEKMPLMNNDSSASSSPIRSKKSKDSTGTKDEGKSKENYKK